MNKKLKLKLIFSIVIIGLSFAYFAVISAQKPFIEIDSITQDKYIEGKVSNFKNPENYKVLVYVHTDMWYIHPYADRGEEMSWATIDKTGKWTLCTVKREYEANSIAALVVDPSAAEDALSSTFNLKKIKNHALIIYSKEEMKEKGWHGKL